MATYPNANPAPDDELAQATSPRWAPVTNRLLAEIDPEPQSDDDPPEPVPGR